MLPPPLVAACRGELVISLKFQLQSAACRTSAMSDAATPRTSARSRQPACRLRFPRRCRRSVLVSLVEARTLRSGKLRHRTSVLISLWVTNPASLGKRRYAHTAADLHVRSGFSNRAGLKNRWTPRAM